jgi:hypothetical protein
MTLRGSGSSQLATLGESLICWAFDKRACSTEAEFMNDNFVDVSGHNLESSKTSGFHIQCLNYKPVSNNCCKEENS